MLLVSLLPLLLGSCGSFSAPPRDTFYRIAVAPAAPGEARAGMVPVLVVAPFAVSGLHNERALVFAHEDGTTLEQYGLHYWIDSPRTMLQTTLSDYLADSLNVKTTLQPVRDVDNHVRGRLLRFERSAGERGNMAIVVLHLEVFGRSTQTMPLLSKRYERSTQVSGDNVSDVVAAINRAVADIFAEFAGDLATTI